MLTKEGTLAPMALEQQADYDIDYGSVDAGGSKCRVIVTRPRTAGKHPAVLLLGGIGCYSLDGLLRGPEPRDSYGKILDVLTRAGYVTMRVEKSGMGDEVERRMRRHEVCAHRFFVEKQPAGSDCAGELAAPQPLTYMQQVGSLDLAAPRFTRDGRRTWRAWGWITA